MTTPTKHHVIAIVEQYQRAVDAGDTLREGMGMLYRISGHTRDQMMDRDISEAEIDQTLRRSHGRYRDPKGNPVFYRLIAGRLIHVVVRKGTANPMVTRTTWYE